MKNFKIFFYILSFIFFLFFFIFVFNQTITTVQFAENIYPGSGKYTLYSLLTIYSILILIPFYYIMKLPVSLTIPDKDDKDYNKKIKKLIKIFRNNKIIIEKEIYIEDEKDLMHAIEILDKEAHNTVCGYAKNVFISTAISQYGKLDGLLVFIQQTVMIWKVARIYNLRPDIKGLFNIYINVLASTFFTVKLEEIDVSEYLEPVTEELFSSILIGNIPGMTAVSSLIISSMMDGLSNAFLTLRVGIMTSKICTASPETDKGMLRRSASLKASGLLGIIVKDSAVNIVKAIKKSATRTGIKGIKKIKNIFKK